MSAQFIEGDNIMKTKMKRIVAVFSMAVMLVISAVPAMATEQLQNELNVNLVQEDSTRSASTLVTEFHSSKPMWKNTVVGYVQIDKDCDMVKWRVGTSTGVVILNLTNESTGEVRSITAAANNQEDSLAWVSPLPAGKWKISVAKINKTVIIGGVNLYFYT